MLLRSRTQNNFARFNVVGADNAVVVSSVCVLAVLGYLTVRGQGQRDEISKARGCGRRVNVAPRQQHSRPWHSRPRCPAHRSYPEAGNCCVARALPLGNAGAVRKIPRAASAIGRGSNEHVLTDECKRDHSAAMASECVLQRRLVRFIRTDKAFLCHTPHADGAVVTTAVAKVALVTESQREDSTAGERGRGERKDCEPPEGTRGQAL